MLAMDRSNPEAHHGSRDGGAIVRVQGPSPSPKIRDPSQIWPPSAATPCRTRIVMRGRRMRCSSESVEVHRGLGPDGYGDVRLVTGVAMLAPQAFPDVELRTADIFA